MNHQLTLQVLGARGSMPCSGVQFQRYGGNTSCFFLQIKEHGIIFDAGTGIVQLNHKLPEQIEHIHILISHMHIDHIQGLPFLKDLFESGRKITFYGQRREEKGIREQIDYFLNPLLWPVGIANFQKNVEFVTLSIPEKREIANTFLIETEQSFHPGDSTLYRITYQDTSVVYGLDFEHNEISSERLVNFARNSSCLIYDSYYLPEEYGTYIGWGHSTWEEGVRIKQYGNIKKLLLSHHYTERTDQFLDKLQEEIWKVDRDTVLAKEGMEIKL